VNKKVKLLAAITITSLLVARGLTRVRLADGVSSGVSQVFQG
jgi:hypothetical protein